MTAANPLGGVRAILLADAAVTALVSTRVYSGTLPSGTSPLTVGGCIVLNPSGGPANPGILGEYGVSRIDTLCYGKDPGNAYNVYLAVYAALKGAASQTIGGVLVHSVNVMSKGALGTDPVTQWPLCLASFSVLADEVS